MEVFGLLIVSPFEIGDFICLERYMGKGKRAKRKEGEKREGPPHIEFL